MRSTGIFQRMKSRYKGIAQICHGSNVDSDSRLLDFLCGESESVGGMANVKIRYHFIAMAHLLLALFD